MKEIAKIKTVNRGSYKENSSYYPKGEKEMSTWSNIIALRMERQYLTTPVGKRNYDRLFQDMSPVPTKYWTEPGDPPTLPAHSDFDDYDYNSRRRAKRDLLKGRFAGGNIAYVAKEDLELFACLYKKELSEYSNIALELMNLLEREGPMNIQLMKELTGLLVKQITPELHKLQEAFLVYEDQLDNDRDRGWYLFENEFPEINPNRYSKKEALKRVISRVGRLLVFFDVEMLRSFYRLPIKLIKEVVEELVKEGVILEVVIEGRKGFLLMEDREYLQEHSFEQVKPQVILLGRNDFLVRAYVEQLKKPYTSDYDTLYYLLIDGEFHGAVVGKFKFGPHVLEDVIIDLPKEEKTKRRAEIMAAIYMVFDEKLSPLKRYDQNEIRKS